TEAETRDWRVSQGPTTIWICGLYRHGLRREVFRSFSISSVFARRRGSVRTRRGRAGIPAENRQRETFDARTAFKIGAEEVAPGQYGGHAPGSLRGAGSGVDGERAARRGGGGYSDGSSAPGSTFFPRGRLSGSPVPGTAANFVRKVYQCCQGGGVCSSVKGIQGRMRGDRDVEFLLSGDVLSLAVTRAELHLQIFNPLHLDVRPVLPSRAEDGLPTRYSLWSEGTRAELRVDLLFLLRGLQGAAGGTGAGGGHSVVNMRRMAFIQKPASLALQEARGQTRGGGVLTKLPDLELGLVLSCSRGGAAVSCGSGSVQLSHTPFVALYYR
ncbi:uncharacterized protein LOC103398121, partial [Cynoglossus semilaevis]